METAAARGSRRRTPPSGALSAVLPLDSSTGRPSARLGRRSSSSRSRRRSSESTTELLNFAPTFVYVIFWLGVPLLSILFGNVWRALSPWRASRTRPCGSSSAEAERRSPVLQWSGPLGAVSSGRRALRVRRARAHEPAAGLPAHARDRDGALLVLGACGHGGLRPRRLVARRRRIRRRVPAPLAHRSVRRSGRSRRRALALHRARRRRAGPRDAGLRRRDARLHELRRLLAHDHVEQPHRRHPSGLGRIGSAHGRSRDDARERRGADAIRRGGDAHVPRRGLGGSRSDPIATITRPGLRPPAGADRRRVHGRALLLVVRHPGSVHHPARVRSLRPRLGSLRDGRLGAESRRSSRRTRSGTSRSGRSSSAMSRVSRSRTIARWRSSRIGAPLCARSIRCSR